MSPPTSASKPALADAAQEIGQIARGAGVGMGGNLLFNAVGYLFGILVARQIGAQEYGLYTLGVTAATLASLLTLIGLDRGLMRFASISRGEGKGAELRFLVRLALIAGGCSGLIGGALLWFQPQLILRVLRWEEQPGLLTLLPILAISVPATTLTGIAIAGTQAFRTMRYRALVTNAVQPVLKLVAALALVGMVGATAVAPALGYVIAQVVGSLLALFFLFRLARRLPASASSDPPQRRSAAGRLVRFSGPLMANNFLEYLNGRTEILVLGMFLAANTAGIYNAAGRLAGLGLIVLTAFNAIFSPLISDLHHRGQSDRLSALFKLVTRTVVSFAMPIFVIQMLFAPQLMSLFGPEFAAGAAVLRWLSLGQMLNFCTGSVGIMLIMTGRSDITLINSIVTVMLALALDFWLVPAYGLLGAALAGASILILVNLVRLIEVWWLLRLHPFSPAFLKPFLAALPALAAGWLWQRWQPPASLVALVIACLVVGGVYLAARLALGLDEGERMMLASLRQRLAPRRKGRPA